MTRVDLTEEERIKFIAWLHAQSQQEQLLLEQIEKLNIQPMIHMKLSQIASYKLVITELLPRETQTIN